MLEAARAFRFLVGDVFLLAGLAKLADRPSFESAVIQYGLLPQRLVRPVTRTLPTLEVVAGALLLGGLGLVYVSGAVAATILVFTLAVAYNLARGRSFDCGCRAPGAPRKIGWGIVSRNLVLLAMSVIVTGWAPSALALDALVRHRAPTGHGTGDAVALLVAAGLAVFAATLATEAFALRRAVAARLSVGS